MLSCSTEFKNEVDNVLYALGKAIKVKREKKNLVCIVTRKNGQKETIKIGGLELTLRFVRIEEAPEVKLKLINSFKAEPKKKGLKGGQKDK